MSKAVTAIATLGVGLGVFAMIAEIQNDPFTFTTPWETGVQMPNPTVAPARDAANITLDAVRAALGPVEAVSNSQLGAKHRTAAASHAVSAAGSEPAANTPSETPRDLAPCSPWRDLGPKLGPVDGEPSSRSVRQLC